MAGMTRRQGLTAGVAGVTSLAVGTAFGELAAQENTLPKYHLYGKVQNGYVYGIFMCSHHKPFYTAGAEVGELVDFEKGFTFDITLNEHIACVVNSREFWEKSDVERQRIMDDLIASQNLVV